MTGDEAMANQGKKGNTRSVSALDERETKQMIAEKMSFAASEAYKLLRTNLMFSFSGSEECRVIGLTSSFRGEGKSLTSINLAYTLAENRKNVLLIEGDMRLPTLSGRLGLRASPGLSNLLVGLNSVTEALQTYEAKQEDGAIVSMNVLVSGDVPPNPSELLGSERMQALITALRGHYEYIVFDLPPVTAVADALVASQLTDGMVIVVRGSQTARGALAETIRQLKLVDARLLGFVFNGAADAGAEHYKGAYGYKKGYYRK